MDPAATEIYTLSLHDALPISATSCRPRWPRSSRWASRPVKTRSEEHTSELQSRGHLVCRLLLEKKKILLHLLIATGLAGALTAVSVLVAWRRTSRAKQQADEW